MPALTQKTEAIWYILPWSEIKNLIHYYSKPANHNTPGGIDLSLTLDDIDVMADEEDQMPLFDLQNANINGLQVQMVDIRPFQNVAFDN